LVNGYLQILKAPPFSLSLVVRNNNFSEYVSYILEMVELVAILNGSNGMIFLELSPIISLSLLTVNLTSHIHLESPALKNNIIIYFTKQQFKYQKYIL
jgi:hypothetical protein